MQSGEHGGHDEFGVPLRRVVGEIFHSQTLFTVWKLAFFSFYTVLLLEAALAVLGGRAFSWGDLLAEPAVRAAAVVAVGIHIVWWIRVALDRKGTERAAHEADVEKLSALQCALVSDGEETGIRVAAGRALGSLRERAPVTTLKNVAARDHNPRVRAAAAEGLLLARGRRLSFAPAMQALRDDEPSVRESAARALAALAQLREEASVPRISGAPLLADETLLAAVQARSALEGLGIEAPYLELLDPC